MLKKFVLYCGTFAILFFIGFFGHNAYLGESLSNLPFSLKNVYLFHASFSCFICVALLLITYLTHLKDQVGFLYLAFFVLKFVFFGIAFSELFFENVELSLSNKLSLLTPLFLFLVVEVVFIVQLLNKPVAANK